MVSMRAASKCVGQMGLLWVFATGCLDRPLVKGSPKTSNVFVDQLAQTAVNKIDLLFMVDNSTSMADKQEILRNAVPVLVNRLVSPICVDTLSGAPTGDNSVAGRCTSGEPEFPPIADIHVGIVTSSLGSHGGTSVCAGAAPGDTPNDRAHLLGSVRPRGSNPDPKLVFDASQTWNQSGFLAWDLKQSDVPTPGSHDATAFATSVGDMIGATGEHGCGYEASLESWYRFLVDPEPPANVTRDHSDPPQTVRGSALVTNPDGSTTCNGCDMELLAQRQAFLRPDSLVAIVMLSDENDCSIRDDGVGWFVGSSSAMPRSTAVCATNPNDKCCRSCAIPGSLGRAAGSPTPVEPAPPPGCGLLSADAGCQPVPAGQRYATWAPPNDSPNLRCYQQHQRFGLDFLYPTSRYVNALTSPTLTLQSDGQTTVQNPLFDGHGTAPRPQSLVFLAGIVGVPWQDIADDASLAGPGLNYLSAAELVSKGRWPMLLGEPNASPPVPPSDPFMIESPTPRAGTNPVTGNAIVSADSTNPTASPINGHEQSVPNFNDLQYACTFPLAAPKLCLPGDPACDCAATSKGDFSAVAAANSPLCQPPGGGAAQNTQRYAKAYPGVRELQVLKDFKDRGIVASICPKGQVTNPSSDPSYGYNPAVAAIISTLKRVLIAKCLPRAVQTDPVTHEVLCRVVEAQRSGCDCALQGREPVDPELAPAVEAQLQAVGECGVPGKAPCSTWCQCGIKQEVDDATGANLTACKTGAPAAPGYCYVDDPASPLVQKCPPNQKRLLRFVDTPTNRLPADGAVAFVACLGAPIASATPGGP